MEPSSLRREAAVGRIMRWVGRPAKSSSAQEVLELKAALGTTVGEVRLENQDRAVIARFCCRGNGSEIVVAALCDGMGGMVDGGQCADLAVAHFLISLIDGLHEDRTELLNNAIAAANSSIYGRYRGRGGTTIASVLYGFDGVTAATVGDTRVYGVNEHQIARQLSLDDTVAAEVGKARGVDASQLHLGHLSGGLAQYVGMGPGLEPRTYELASQLAGFCLSTDGAHAPGTPVFELLLGAAKNPLLAVTRILQLSRWIGGKDNASVIVLPSGGLEEKADSSDQEHQALEIWDSSSKLELAFGGVGFREPLREALQSVQHHAFSPDLHTLPSAERARSGQKRRRSGGRDKQNPRAPSGGATPPRLEIEVEEPPIDPPLSRGKPSETASSENPSTGDQSHSEEQRPDCNTEVKRNGPV